MKTMHIFFLALAFCNVHKVVAFTVLVCGGERGWVGQKIVTILHHQGHKVVCSQTRLENREQLEQEILTVQPNFIINSAGIVGKPNVNWCEDHKQETLRSNVLGLLNLVDLAFIHGIHVTNIATGCIYQYDATHMPGSGIGFTEKDEPNFTGSFYSRYKVIAEKLILEYPNVLNLRLAKPVSSDLHPNSFIGKIIRYKKLINIPNTLCVLEDLLPLLSTMLARGLTGNYNFANKGTITHNEVMEFYKKYVDPSHIYENFTVEEQNAQLKVPRANNELSVEKLLKEFPHIPHIKESIQKVFINIKRRGNDGK